MVTSTRPCTRSSTRRALRASVRKEQLLPRPRRRRQMRATALACSRPMDLDDLRWYSWSASSTPRRAHMCFDATQWTQVIEKLMIFLESYVNQEEKKFQVKWVKKEEISIINLQSKKKARFLMNNLLSTDDWISLLQRDLNKVGIQSNFSVLSREDPFFYVRVCLDVSK